MSNPAKNDLKIIEVQSGSYLGEDDIERFDDNYGRIGEKDEGFDNRCMRIYWLPYMQN